MLRPHKFIPLLVLALAAPAVADIITVAPDGPLTIQAAVLQAQDGDVVELLDGVYTGPGNRDIRLHGKAITIRSQGGEPATCILDTEGSPADHHRAFELADYEELDTVIEGLTITGGHAGWGAGIWCWGGGATVRNCRFIGNTAEAEGGGLAASEEVHVIDCWFEGNSASASGGLSVYNYGEGTIEGCTFARNYAELYGGGFRN